MNVGKVEGRERSRRQGSGRKENGRKEGRREEVKSVLILHWENCNSSFTHRIAKKDG